ncbi:FAD-binding oxidoreductase [Neomegalonema perideroedes]|uniref:FAD-binding oxidoreductase n=1 Tax=Neomegalonema perideroedes TaxID=217219 RepID=UPI000374B472|nr:FAD-binding oxidoreductase [Neomegalonema perideroedes]
MNLCEPTEDFLSAAKSLLGDAGWRAGAEAAGYLTEPRGLYQGKAALVARPNSTQQAADLVRLCAGARVGIVPWGGGTGLVGGQVKPAGPTPVLLSLERLNRLRSVSRADEAMTLEAGATLAAAQAAAEAEDRLFPLSLASEGSCTVGGILSTNAGGVQVLRYGNARDLCLGLEVVTAQGEIWDGLSPLRKNNTGYDLRHLFIGAEGTLGIVTAATLKLFPRPRAWATGFAALASPAAGLALLARAQAASDGAVSAFELMPAFGLDLSLRFNPGTTSPLEAPAPWMALVEISGARPEPVAEALEAAFGAAWEAGEITDAAVAASEAQRQALWRLRESLSEAQKLEGGGIKHDVSLPPRRIPEFLEQAAALIERLAPGARPCPFGHMGDGNLHYNVLPPSLAEKAPFLARWREISEAVHDLVLSYGGSISAEHGIGRLKAQELARTADPAKMAMIRRIKGALDPLGILNPGVILPEAL